MDNLEQLTEVVAENVANKYSAIFTRLQNKGFSRREAFILLKMFVLGDQISINIFDGTDDEEF